MKYYIYKIENPLGEVYIGRTKNIEKRIDMYSRYTTLNRQPKLFDSFDLYGFNNHHIEVIEYTKNLNQESYYIETYGSYKKGLNSNKGGGGPQYHSEDSREKISMQSKKNKGMRLISHWKGKKRTEENKRRISESKKGIPIPGNRKPILQYDKEGSLIQEFNSIEEAAKIIGGSPTAINNALRKGGNATSSGYLWKYKNPQNK